MLGGNYQPIPELLPTRPFSLPLPPDPTPPTKNISTSLDKKWYPWKWNRGKAEGEDEWERERKKLYIFSQNGDSGKSSSCLLLLSVWMLPLKVRQQVFLWSGRVNKATWIWMRKQSWSHTHLLLTPLSGRRWGIHVWKRKTAEGGGICLHKKSIIWRLSEQSVLTITDYLSADAIIIWRAFHVTKHNRSSMGLMNIEQALYIMLCLCMSKF